MKTVLQWLVITFTATNSFAQHHGIVIDSNSNCTEHGHCPDSQACILGYCGDPCESLCGVNTYCTTFQHIPVCACKEGHTGNAFIRCDLRGDVCTDTPPTAPQPSVSLPKRCRIPNDSPTMKYCSTAVGCESCNFNNTTCHLPFVKQVNAGVKVKEVCASVPVAQINTATCDSRGWNPPFPKCQYRCGVSKAVNRSTPTTVERQAADVGYFPWHVGIHYLEKGKGIESAKLIGAGTLITKRIVLTDYDSMSHAELSQHRVALGKHYKYLVDQEETAVIRNVTEMFIPSYDFTLERESLFEVVLVLLSEEVQFSEYIRPVCLYYGKYSNELIRNSPLYVVGWEEEKSKRLHATLDYKTVTLMSEPECEKLIKKDDFNFKGRFCHNNTELVRTGDFGRGLTAVDEDGLHYLIGYMSYYDIKTPHLQVYSNLLWGKKRDWIDSIQLFF